MSDSGKRTSEAEFPPLEASDGDERDPTRRMLVVDDELSIRIALAKFLTRRGYHVDTASGGAEALELLHAGQFALMISDLRMPGMDGQQLVSAALGVDPDLAIVMLTGTNDAVTANEVLAMGASDYLVKPIDLERLSASVDKALYKRRLRVEQRTVDRLIRETVIERTGELEKEKAALRALTVSIAETLINAMEAKDLYLRGHSQRVADLGASIAQELGLDEDTVEQVRLAGRLHDVGKIGIREPVLNKPGPLTTEEFDHVKDHVRIGMEILAPLQHLGPVLRFIEDHHERVDGMGYPRGIAGDEISMGGRILSIADAFDALTSRRAYREPLSPKETMFTMLSEADKRFDRQVLTALHNLQSRRKSLIFLDDFVTTAEAADSTASAK
jgi:putative nucleotidyltransferase with HDIG domain